MYDKVEGPPGLDEPSIVPFVTTASNIVSLRSAACGNWETGSVLFEAIASSFDGAAWKDDFSRTCVTSEPRVVAAVRAARGGANCVLGYRAVELIGKRRVLFSLLRLSGSRLD